MDIFSSVKKRLSSKDLVYIEIKKKIIEGILKPNESIIEENLASEMKISRTPVREAILRLELEELITRLPNGRLKVATISVEEVKGIYAVREMIEDMVAKEATRFVDDYDVQVLGRISMNMLEAANSNRCEEVVFYGNEFHFYLYKISKNKTAMKILLQLNDHIDRYRRLGPKNNYSRCIEAANEHREIFHAIQFKDEEKVELLMRQHIKNSQESALNSIKILLPEENSCN